MPGYFGKENFQIATMSDNGGGEDGQTVFFKRKTMAKVPSWGEPILLIIAVVCFIPFLGYMILVGVPYVVTLRKFCQNTNQHLASIS